LVRAREDVRRQTPNPDKLLTQACRNGGLLITAEAPIWQLSR
jgi:hypothetical protein